MKKMLSLLLVSVLLFALCGCSKKAPAAAPTSAPAVQEAPAPAAEPAPAAPSAAQEPVEAAEPTPAPAPPADFAPDFTFSAVDRDGNEYDESVFAGHAITIINAWTPWSEPSVSGMAALEKLWENYRDRGLMVFGVYGMSTTAEEIKAAKAQTGASYPFIGFAPAFIDYQSGSFPNTILVDSKGHVVTHTPDPDVLADLVYNFDRDWAEFLAERVYVAPLSYEEWESVILPYLTK